MVDGLVGSLSVDWAGEPWLLLPDRAVFRHRTGSLILADLHLGKAAAFRAAGIPVPEIVHAELQRLDRLVSFTRARSLIIVGDLIHAAAGRTPTVLGAVTAWRLRHAALPVTLVRGNHDHAAGDPPRDWRIATHAAPFTPAGEPRVAFVHDPETEASPGLACIGGHLHPCAVLSDGSTSVRAPCFWLRPDVLVLPAFGRFTGTHPIRPASADRVFAIGDGQVIEVRAVRSAPKPRRRRSARSAPPA